VIYRKRGVRMNGVQPECLLGIMLASQVFADHGQRMTLTSVTEDAPGRLPNSRHKIGLAFDIRVWNLGGKAARQVWVQRLEAALGGEWDIVDRDDHIHCEFDPPEAREP